MTDRMAKSGGGAISAPQTMQRVWDPFVRFFHWSQALLVAVSWLTADTLKTVHKASGYAIALLLAARVIWGFIGTRHARFSDFLHGPRVLARYLGLLWQGKEPRHLGHNPAGGAMVLALILTVGATALTGWLQTTDAFWGSDAMEEGHEALATLILILVVFHLGGVLLASLRHRENLVHAMLDGRKRPLTPEDGTE